MNTSNPWQEMHLSGLFRYPLKSAMAESLAEAVIQTRGIEFDRRWMICTEDGRFITGRQHGELVRWRALATDIGLCITHPSGHQLTVELTELLPIRTSALRATVQIWSDRVDAAVAPAGVNDAISAWLGQRCQLVYMDTLAARTVDPRYAREGDEVSFADGYPYLLIGQGSLDGLNARLAHPISMLRFRPNLVVAGTLAHAEDDWSRIRIGDVDFDLVKPCTRCVFTTVDPLDGQRDALGEPLSTLKTYRRTASGVTFGMNVIARGSGIVRVGDSVSVLA